MDVSERSGLVTYAIRDIVSEAKRLEKAGTKMIYLNIGDPALFGFHPPEHILNAAKKALEKGLTGYAPSQGDPELVKTISLSEGVAEDSVFVTAGLSEGIDFFFHAMMDAGDSITLPSPTYPLYITKQNVFDGVENYHNCDRNWEPDVESLRKSITTKTKAIVVINPNNPTGAVYSKKTLKAIFDIAGEKKLPIFADNAYEMMVFDGEMVDIRKLAKDVPLIIGGSLSKNYLYPGARIGWLALHGDDMNGLKDALQRLCNQRLSVNWEMQKAAVSALKGPKKFMDSFNSELKKRASFISKEISRVNGLSLIPPKGAFYAFIKLESKKWKSDWDFCRALLREGVVTVPGSAFSSKLDGLYFRIVFLPKPEILEEAFRRIERLITV